MFLYTAKLSKKKLLFFLLLLSLFSAIVFFLTRDTPPEDALVPLTLTTNEERLTYLSDLGWQVSPQPLETLDFTLPSPLTDPYLIYNELQNAQGFDLSMVAGQQVTRYTYSVTNHPLRESGVQLNLYVHDCTPVAGDIICPGADGFQSSLVYPALD